MFNQSDELTADFYEMYNITGEKNNMFKFSNFKAVYKNINGEIILDDILAASHCDAIIIAKEYAKQNNLKLQEVNFTND